MIPHSRGAIPSRGRPAFIFSQFASSSRRWSDAHSRIRRSAVRDWMFPTTISPSKLNFVANRCLPGRRGSVAASAGHGEDDGGDDD